MRESVALLGGRSFDQPEARNPLAFFARGFRVFTQFDMGGLLPATCILTPPQGHDMPAFAGLGPIGRIWAAMRCEFPNLIRPMDAAPLPGVSMATLYRMGPPVRHLTRNMAYIDAAWLDAHGADIPIAVSFDHAPTVRETARLLSCSTRPGMTTIRIPTTSSRAASARP